MISDPPSNPDLERRWRVRFVGFIIVALATALILSREAPKANRRGVVVLAARYTNGEQFVTLRSEPRDTEITFTSLVSASDDGKSQPRIIRSSGQLFPVSDGKETNYTLHFVALPKRGASIGGKPVPYTPGSYTLAYTPTEEANRLRVGVAFARKGIGDYVGRLRKCWEQKTLGPLEAKSYEDAIFITSEPITNAAPRIELKQETPPDVTRP